jgi:hypothetical protein
MIDLQIEVMKYVKNMQRKIGELDYIRMRRMNDYDIQGIGCFH